MRANIGKRTGVVDAETTPLRDPEHYQYDLNLPDITEVWRRGSVIASWLLDLSAAALIETRPCEIRGPGVRLRRRPVDHQGRDRRRRAGPCAVVGPLRAVQLPGARRISRTSCSRPCATSSGGHLEKAAKP